MRTQRGIAKCLNSRLNKWHLLKRKKKQSLDSLHGGLHLELALNTASATPTPSFPWVLLLVLQSRPHHPGPRYY